MFSARPVIDPETRAKTSMNLPYPKRANVPDKAQAQSSWPRLWSAADITDMPTKLMNRRNRQLLFLSVMRATVATVEIKLPQRLIKPAVAPRVIKAKETFIAMTYSPPMGEIVAAATKAMFESPSLIPATPELKMRLSARLSTSVRAPRMPKSETFFEMEMLFISISDNVGVRAFALNDDDDPVRDAGYAFPGAADLPLTDAKPVFAVCRGDADPVLFE